MPIGTIANAESGASVRNKLNQVIAATNAAFDPANPGPIGAGTPSTINATRLSVAQGTLTDPVTGINLSATWNDAADTFRGLEFVVTDTASAAGSTLFRILGGAAGTTELLRILKSGKIEAIPQSFNMPTFGAIDFPNHGISFSGGFPCLMAQNQEAVGSVFTNVNGTSRSLGCVQALHIVGFGVFGSGTGFGGNVILTNYAPNELTIGALHATTPTAQRIQAHGVTTGTGASLTLGGGSGDTKGDVILDGGNRSVYIASPSATEIRDILISHGLMAAS
jgi:hypothetical protein